MSIRRLSRILTVALAIVAMGAGSLVATTPAAAADVYDDMRIAWVERLTGGTTFDPAAAPFAAQVLAITSEAQTHWDAVDVTPSPEPWADLATATSVEDLLTAVRRIRSMALAYATHGSALEGDAALLGDSVALLDWVNANRYSATISPTGNWWQREIGIPLELNETTAMLYDDLSSTQIDAYMAAVHRFSPSVTSTGANRVWKAMVVAGRGVIKKESAALVAATTSLGPVFSYVTTGDGFYPDGSFLQHQRYAYTGSYGLSVLTNLADLMALLDGTTWEIADPNVGNVYAWMRDAFDPFFFRGALMDTVRGREISRSANGEHDAGAELIRASLLLAQAAPATEQSWIYPMLKQWIGSATYRSFFEAGPLHALTLGEALMNDSAVTARSELAGNFLYPSMARVAHHRPGYSAAVSLFSRTIGSYESINGENLRGWYTGEGMVSLYTDDASQFSGNYWPTVNPYRLPGTTVDTQVRGPGSGAGYLNLHRFSGGVTSTSGKYGAVGLSVDAYGTSLFAQKSWFLFDDEVVAVGSGITNTGQSGNGWDGTTRRVETTADSRKLRSPSQALTVDNVATAASSGSVETKANPTWAHLSSAAGAGNMGYYFPGAGAVNFLRENRTGSWADLNTTYGSPSPVTNDFLTMWFDHGTNPTAGTYQYVLLPNKTLAQTQTYAAAPDAQILANSANVHAVRESGLHLVAANFWTDQVNVVSSGSTPILSSDRKASVLLEEVSGGGFTVTVADPTKANTGTIAIEVFRPSTGVISSSPGVTVTQLSPTIRFTVNVNAANGAGFEAAFH